MSNVFNVLDEIEIYKYSPSAIIQTSFDRLNKIINSDYELTNASNPFIYLLENSALNTAFSIQEYTLILKKLFPRLANNEKDLYLHMSDYDYLGIFSEPAFAEVEFNILYNDFIKYAKYDPITSFYIFKIPRNFQIKVDKYIFSLTHPIEVTKSVNNVLNVRFNNHLKNNIFPLETNYINFDVYAINQTEKYINFKVRLPEIDIESLEVLVQKSILIKNSINYNPNRNFYFLEAYYLDNENNWKEMIVTHTNDVYDINTPTLCITVNESNKTVDYYLPNTYVNSNIIKDKIKILVYTTNGYIDVNFNDFKASDFTSEYNKVIPEYDLDENTSPLHLITKSVIIRDRVIGGKNKLQFKDLKEAVINNSIGDRKLPITDKQIEFLATQNNFNLIKLIDILTNRTYGLEIKLPKPNIEYLVTTPNFDIIELKTDLQTLKNLNYIIDITPNIKIIPEGTLFKVTNNGLELISNTEKSELDSLSGTNLVNKLINEKLAASYFHYILDTSSEENDLRAYELNSAQVLKINFKDVNDTIKIGINTIAANITKHENGYYLDIRSNYKKYSNSITYYNVTPYLIYEINNSYFYLEGHLYTVLDEKPVYRFNLQTNFFISKENKIFFNNFKDFNNITTSINIPLTTSLTLVYLCNVIGNNYTPIAANRYIENSYLALGNSVVTYEEINLTFGTFLKYLYRRLHNNISKVEYEKYTENVPLRYEHNVYDNNNNIIHYKNDIVYDNEGNIVYKHRINDVKFDENGNPILVSEQKIERYLSLFVQDAKYYFANSNDILNFKKKLKDYILYNLEVIENNIHKQLLENTEAFLIIPKTLDILLVKINNRTVKSLYSDQSFIFDIYVDNNTYNNKDIRSSINSIIVTELSLYLENNRILKKTEILDIIYNKIKEYVKTIKLDLFTELNSEYIEIITDGGRISIKKIFDLSHDGYIIREDIKFNYILIE